MHTGSSVRSQACVWTRNCQGPSGSAARATLGLIVNCLAVQKALWPSRRAEIKALLADEKGRFDKEELLAHIINNSLGRPLLPQGNAARDIGTAANNALKKEKRETAEANFAKARTGAAISAARAVGLSQDISHFILTFASPGGREKNR